MDRDSYFLHSMPVNIKICLLLVKSTPFDNCVSRKESLIKEKPSKISQILFTISTKKSLDSNVL